MYKVREKWQQRVPIARSNTIIHRACTSEEQFAPEIRDGKVGSVARTMNQTFLEAWAEWVREHLRGTTGHEDGGQSGYLESVEYS